MTLLIILCRACVAYVASAGFLFGQLFFGQFEIHATIAGACGLAMLILSISLAAKTQLMTTITYFCGIMALGGASYDMAEYYLNVSPNSGSYYPWFLIVPYIISLVFLMWELFSRLKRRNNT